MATAIASAQNIENTIGGCLAAGAIGDALGSFHEGRDRVLMAEVGWIRGITDDTQLTMATAESIIAAKKVSPEAIAKKLLEWFIAGKLSGLGETTLKALRDLQVGVQWGSSGRSGEFAASNGAASRIAPLAFFADLELDRTLIRDVCNITHKNDEAFAGCLAILYALRIVMTKGWEGDNLVELVANRIPDTGVRDNLLLLNKNAPHDIAAAGNLIGTTSHVTASVPFAIFAAKQIRHNNLDNILAEVIACGGDTDTNASMAGQIMGAFQGLKGLSATSMSRLGRIKEGQDILRLSTQLSEIRENKETRENREAREAGEIRVVG